MVKDMLVVSASDPIEKLHLIFSLYRLGISYHFENEIEDYLNHLFISLPNQLIDDKDYDLQTISIVFQVFRFHGYKMLSDVFSKFQDGDGKFKKELIDDVKGIISLYEATHFRMTGEVILDEALTFTTKKLEEIIENQSSDVPPHVRKRIANALFRPYHHSMQRIEARQFISFYKKDESKNDVLLKFAKYDFNRVQLLHQQELSILSSWYKESNMKSKLPYARHRIVEALFYVVGVYFEPRYARARNILCKLTTLIGFLDDTYEAYGLFEELQHLTDAIQRFEIVPMDELPADLKPMFETLLNVHDEVEDQVREEGRSYSVCYTKDEVKKYSTAEQLEARWRHEKYVPTFDEYLENGMYSGCSRMAFAQIMDEDGRGFSTGWTCYMKQHNVSRNETIEAFREKIAGAWKCINEEYCMKPTTVPRAILRAALNYQRMLDFAYRDNDEYTKPELSFKSIIPKVILHPISL
ncbi:hypothetical protein CCACVL1_07328 [Corchorus capsularis]|uniref:(+)-delta-cadinene synthase n=1 Tax=Corchorus capsularis TaxID=210143 RepID=A0A1R3J723_COCAP|nr:hypothetical protein CCACVL1_07328 [Corchorus capsularis]